MTVFSKPSTYSVTVPSRLSVLDFNRSFRRVNSFLLYQHYQRLNFSSPPMGLLLRISVTINLPFELPHEA